MPSGPVTASILHLSDLHLGENAGDRGSTDKASGISWASLKAVVKSRVGNSQTSVMQSHDSFVFAGLQHELRMAARSAGSPDDRFDFHVVTGDISTDADTPERFRFARDFITAQVPFGSGTFGLQFPRASVFCVPGNHDKMQERTLDRYRGAFDDLPAPLPYVRVVPARGGQRFVLFGIDSNLYDRGNIAVGKIDEATVAWLNREGVAHGPEAGLPADTVRVLMLHHHPADLNRFRRRSLKTTVGSFLGDRFTTLREGERLLTACRDTVDVIMHGHEHFPVVFKDEVSGCVVVSAGTASEFQRDYHGGNSFHALLFYGRELRVVKFEWTGAYFTPTQFWEANLDDRAAPLRHRKLPNLRKYERVNFAAAG